MRYFLAVYLFASISLGDVPVLAPFPIFLRAGFSTVLEFEEAPTRVVIGDTQNFQIEKLDKSLVVKTLAPFATTNMFVYFKGKETKVFIITASEDAEPTYYRKFAEVVLPPQPKVAKTSAVIVVPKRGLKVISAKFDAKKDYLTVEVNISANSNAGLRPNWELVRLSEGTKSITPMKLWSERKEVQKDSQIRARFIFVKPNVARNLKGVSLVVPVIGEPSALKVSL